YLGSAEADGGTHTVHGGITSADDDDPVTHHERCPLVRRKLIGSEVAPHQEVRRRVNAAELLFAGYFQRVADACAGSQEDGIEALVEQLIEANVATDPGVDDEFHADLAQEIDLGVDNLLLHLE